MKFGICNEIFKDWEIEKSTAFIAQTGYDAIEIAPFTISDYVTDITEKERRRVREAAAKAGIAISGIHWVLVQTDGIFMNDHNPAIRKRSAQYFCDLVDFCADLGGKSIIVGSPKQRNIPEGVTYEQAWEWARETFTPSVSHAAKMGVTLCLEPLSPSETNFINTAEEAIRFIEQFDSPHCKIILDVKAMSSEAKSIPDVIRNAAPHFAYFHANDANLKGPGFGDVDFKPIAAALKETGYKGYVSVEVFNFEEGPEVIATRSIEYLKKSFA